MHMGLVILVVGKFSKTKQKPQRIRATSCSLNTAYKESCPLAIHVVKAQSALC